MAYKEKSVSRSSLFAFFLGLEGWTQGPLAAIWDIADVRADSLFFRNVRCFSGVNILKRQKVSFGPKKWAKKIFFSLEHKTKGGHSPASVFSPSKKNLAMTIGPIWKPSC